MKAIFLNITFLVSFFCNAQTQKIEFENYKMMNHSPVWDTNDVVKPTRFITISNSYIEFQTIVQYKLEIVSKKHFLDGNIIYKCRSFDDDVTVFFIKNVQMYVYFKKYHLLIKFLK